MVRRMKMNNKNYNDTFERDSKVNIVKEIAERDAIIQQYKLTKFLDREKVINMITELRMKDATIAGFYCLDISKSNNIQSLYVETDEQLDMELVKQKQELELKMLGE